MGYGHTRGRSTEARLALLVVLAVAGALLTPASSAQFQYAVSKQPCFGAAARDQVHPCGNPRLALSVVPTPTQAANTRSPACLRAQRTQQQLVLCRFGVRVAPTSRTVALVGDSHAWHWKPAVVVAAQAEAWRGVSITRSSCAFSNAVPNLPGARGCRQWNLNVLHWFAAHPEVSTVFVSAHAGGNVIVRGQATQLETKIAGYIDAWNALAESVKHIIVIRDTPVSRSGTAACVRRAIAARRAAGAACAVPRAMAIGAPDPEVLAAARLGSSRVRVVDLTPFFCDSNQCYPVVGGALVYRDIGHLTDQFSTSLGPFLRRAVDRVG